ncbi:MAG: protein kinase domain-containing protein, partial [Planctomycetia bacterium]
MTQPPPSDSQSPAERLYFDFAAKRERGEASLSDFEALCAANPQLAAQLRHLAARDAAAQGLLTDAGPATSPPGQKRSPFFRRDRSTQDPKASGFARTLQPGETIGDFKLVRFIGHGGMGQVWEATQLSMRRPVALKFILPGHADSHTLSLFEREARAGGKASHPNLVRTLARGQSEGLEWIAQELVAGSHSLRDAIEDFRREAQLPKEYYQSVAELVRGIALGMEAAHAAGVIHRDLKPQNILIDSDDQPKVVDFGLARVTGDSVLSNTGDFAGTYQYMSPEQVTAKRMGLDHRTDIFSLGVVMYELLTLSRPFDGDTTQKIAEAIVTIVPPDPSTLRAQCPRDLAVICAKAMQKRPGARYGSMKELAADIERHLKNEPILAKPATQLEKARKWVLRHPAASVGIGVGGTALVVISGLLVQQLRTASALKKSNVDLAAQTSRAENNEREAQHNAETAQRNAETAQRNANEAKANMELAERNANDATQKANDVLSLSAQKDYEDLVAAAEKLWQASTEVVPRYEEWLAKARELIEGRPADASKQQKKRPSLVEHKAKLAELRCEALLLSEEQVRADRETHPQYAEWQTKSADLLWRSRMLAIEAWPDRAAVEAELAAELAAKQLPSDPDGLDTLAWKLVDPNQPVIGQEVRALLLAKRALDASSEEKRAGIRDTYAWALYRNGKLDDALAEMKTALTEPGGDELKQSAKDLEKAVQQWQGDE